MPAPVNEPVDEEIESRFTGKETADVLQDLYERLGFVVERHESVFLIQLYVQMIQEQAERASKYALLSSHVLFTQHVRIEDTEFLHIVIRK